MADSPVRGKWRVGRRKLASITLLDYRTLSGISQPSPQHQAVSLRGHLVRLASIPLPVAIDLPAVPDAEDKHDEPVLVDFVDDAVITSAYAPFSGTADELCCCWWTRIGGKKFDSSLDSASRRRIEFAQLA